MSDDFPKALSKTAGVPKTLSYNENFAKIPSISLRTRGCFLSLVGHIHLHSIFRPRALRYCVKRKYSFLVNSSFELGDSSDMQGSSILVPLQMFVLT